MYDFKNYDWLDIHEKVKTEGGKVGFTVLDLFEEYAKNPVKSLRLVRGDFVHPNRTGHQIAAEALLNFRVKGNTISEMINH